MTRSHISKVTSGSSIILEVVELDQWNACKRGVASRLVGPVSKVYNERLLEPCIASLFSALVER
jgi:hypothetical protein